MTSQPLGLRERNRLRTRDEILVAMSVLLGERSFEGITVEDVSQRAGVSRGTIYTYFPDGRDQLVRDAYLRIANQVTLNGTKYREKHTMITERIVALATALVEISTTAEGRFYGMIGSALFGPLGGVTGTASSTFSAMLAEDLHKAQQDGLLSPGLTVDETEVLVSGAIREIGSTAAREPERAPLLLQTLRTTCNTLFSNHSK